MSLENIPLHAAIEMSGAIIAIVVAYLLILLNSTNRGSSFNYSISAALLAMGFLDALHAITPPGNNFVWFHNSASLLGGIFFVSVWLPEKITQKSVKYLPLLAITTAIFVGLLSFVLPMQVPLMISSSGFTEFSKYLSIFSGLLMVIAAIRLYERQRDTNKKEDRFF